MNIPKAFLSYSHDTLDHKKWMLNLATRLRNNGIDAIIDQFELQAGDDVPHFMETHLAKADKILMVCTSRYVEKANKGEGGVGYEKMIITSNLMKQIDENKIIPIIRQNGSTDVPTFLKTKLYLNFSKDDDFEGNYDDLVRTIHKTPLFEKPPIGNNPFKPIEREKLDDDREFLDQVLQACILEMNNTKRPTVYTVSKRLNISVTFLLVGIIKLIDLGYLQWYDPRSEVIVTDQGLLYGHKKNMVK